MLETLEDRMLLAATIVDRVLEIRDYATVLLHSADVQASVVVNAGGIETKFARSELDSITIFGDRSDNEFLVRDHGSISTGDADQFFRVPVRMYGRGGDDTMWGGFGDDTIVGNGGRDKIKASGGNDRIRGGDGNDTISGGAGNDRLEGQDDDDQLFGGSGRDRISGGNGDDLFVGGSGNDKLVFHGAEYEVVLLWDSEESDRIVRDYSQGGVVTSMTIDGISGCATSTEQLCDIILGR
jgi:hypothetical protein